ncbi:hypothetical protein FRC00_010225, partial [Tulasnella sp. 408]
MLLARLSMGLTSGTGTYGVSSLFSIMFGDSLIPLNEVTWQIGVFMGSFFGGMLSHPAERYPELFGNVALLRDWGEDVTEESAVVAELSSAAPLPTTVELLSDPSRRRIIASGFFLAFLTLGFEPLFALWNYTPISLGGLGREAHEIGLLLSTAAVVGMILNAFVFHRLDGRFGSRAVFVTAMSLWSIVFIAMAVIAVIVRAYGASLDFTGSAQIRGLWFATLCVLLVQKMSSLAYP